MSASNAPKANVAASAEGKASAGQTELERIFGGPISLTPARAANTPRLFHGKFADHLWCARCKRTFPNGVYRQVGEFRRCPYAACEGHASVDAMPWERLKAVHPEYPDVPVAGTRYSIEPPPAPARASFF